MKRFPVLLILISLLYVGGCGSSDDPVDPAQANELELSKDEAKLSNTASSSTVTVTSNGTWNATVELGTGWLTVTPASGTGNGSFRIQAADNSQGDTRPGKVVVTQTKDGATVRREVAVEQLGAGPDILIEYPKDQLPVGGKEVVVTVTANIGWEVQVDAQATGWITVLPRSRAFATEDCTLRIAPNTGIKRTGKVVFKSTGDYAVSKTAEFTQEAAETKLEIGQDEFILPYTCESLSVPIDLGDHATQYTVTTTDSWIHWDEQASTATQIVLRLDDNTTAFPRTGGIQVNHVTLEGAVSLFQYGKPDPRIGDDLTAGTLAFPGAEGGGRFTTGGRGGKVYHVTNLSDYANGEAAIPGSLRYGLDLKEPRIIVFDVSGYIELKRAMQIVQPNVSIIGQTAPGDGITLRNYEMSVRHGVNNVLIRFLRVRAGDSTGEETDAISGRWFKQGIVDHVSGSWSVDECMSFYGVQDFTLQWSIASESLNNSHHSKGAHGYGAMFSGDNATCHHFLIASHSSRTPRVSKLDENLNPDNELDYQGFSDMRNLVVYNWNGGGLGAHGGEYNPFNWVNNYFKAGPATGSGSKSWRVMSGSTTSRIYADGNYATANAQTISDNWTYGIWDQMTVTEAEKALIRQNAPHPYSKVTTHSAVDAYERVAEYAGASLRRDAVDERLIRELRAGTATYAGSVSGISGIIDKVSDVGGYPPLKALPTSTDTDGDGIPDIWETAYGLDANKAADAAGFDLDPLGRYSNLEVYFHNLVQHIVYYQNLGGTPMEQNP
ncbi:BACON domain-containing protein [Alistipes sp. OttesenSCG-928-L06]|nr:BACON domain-containing protein [Alistipes sp. OttesenSCG-928-L06]